MKKIVIATAVASMCVAGMAFAASAPVTDFTANSAEVGVGYAFHQSLSGGTGHVSGYSAGLQVGLSDRVAAEYNHVHYNTIKKNYNAFTGYYKVNDNINAYGSVLRLGDVTGWGYQAGIVGYMPLSEKLQGFAKVGLGNKFENSVQLGVKYGLTNNLNLNAYFEHDSVKGDDASGHINGFYTGVGLKF